MKRIYIASAFAFLAGYAANDVIQALSLNVPPAHAEVSGMSWFDLQFDYDFKKAVKSIIEDCVSQGEGEYLYC